jgi:hypothetical protein
MPISQCESAQQSFAANGDGKGEEWESEKLKHLFGYEKRQ